MSQSINLGNVGAATFNGATVDKINLNGSLVWEGMVAVNIWGEHTQLSGQKTLATGYAGIMGEIGTGPGLDFTNEDIALRWNGELGTRVASSVAPSSVVRNPYYKGNKILAAYVTAPNGNLTGAVRAVDTFQSFLHITLEGVHPKSHFKSVTVNGHVFYTADLVTNYSGQPQIDPAAPLGEFTRGSNMPHFYGSSTAEWLRTLTTWSFKLQNTGVEYYVINTYQNNVLEFR
jgi:hypothetical protein